MGTGPVLRSAAFYTYPLGYGDLRCLIVLEAVVPRLTRSLAGLSKRLVVAIPVAMAAGLGLGLLVDLRSWQVAVLPLTMLMVYPMLVTFRPASAFNSEHGRAVGVAMSLNFLVLPFVAWGLALAFFRNEPGLYVGMVLAGLFPTSGMTISWTGFAQGNVAAAVKMTVLGLIAASLLAPVYLQVLAGAVVSIDLLGVLRTIVLVIGVPMLAGWATRVLAVRRMGRERFQKQLVPVLPGISTLGVLALVALALGLQAQRIVGEPALLARVAVPLVLFYGINFALSTLVSRALLPRGDAIAVVYGTVMRNLSIALGLAIATFGPEAALLVAAAYVVQVQGAAWYVRATPRVFGPAPVTAGAPPSTPQTTPLASRTQA